MCFYAGASPEDENSVFFKCFVMYFIWCDGGNRIFHLGVYCTVLSNEHIQRIFHVL